MRICALTQPSMRARLVGAAAWPLVVCGLAGTATASPITISYAAIVTSNVGDATDGVFPPGTIIRVRVQVDSESLLTGTFLPASGSAETVGAPNATLPVELAGSAQVVAVPGATARVYSFRGEGPVFLADGDPPSVDLWQWTDANLYLPLVANLDELLALTLNDVNELMAVFGSVTLLTFSHPIPNGLEFERARTARLYEFSIEADQVVPEPATITLVLLGFAAASGSAARRRLKPSRGTKKDAGGLGTRVLREAGVE